jgi:predicted amidohydrolase
VGLAQTACKAGDISANCARYREFSARAAGAGCGLLLFPELSDTGYDLPHIARDASPLDGAPLTTLRECAAAHGLAIGAGLSERAPEGIYNTLAFITPDGALATLYHKLHLFGSERGAFLPGGELVTTAWGGLTFGLSICYDLRFPELYRALALRGADVFINCAAWPAARANHWRILAAARAVENQAWLLGCGRIGEDAGLAFAGASCVISPWGEAQRAGSGEQLLVAEINRRAVDQTRSAIPVFADRRTDVYG